MYVLRHLLEALLNPFFLTLGLFAVLLLLLYQKSNSGLFWGFLSVFLMLILFSTSWFPHLLTNYLESKYQVVTVPDQAIKTVVVLSGGQSDNRKNLPVNMTLYSASIKRLIEGIRLYKQIPGAKLVLSGGGYAKETPEANHLAEDAEWFGIPHSDIILENSSINTADQARELKRLLGEQPFYLVTSATHMHRSMLLCKAQGLKPIPAPTDFTVYWQDERLDKRYLPDPHNLVYLSIAMHEILGMLWQTGK